MAHQRLKVSVLLLFLTPSVIVASSGCSTEALAPLPFVLEYALWRGWKQAVVFSPNNEPSCTWAIVRLVKCLSVNGIASAVNSTKPQVHSNLGIVVLAPHLRYNSTCSYKALDMLLKELQNMQMSTASYDSIITTRSDQDYRHVHNMLNDTSIRFDQNIVVAYPTHNNRIENPLQGLCDTNFSYGSKRQYQNDKKCSGNKKYKYDRSCLHHTTLYDAKTKPKDGYFRSTERFKNLAKNQTYKRHGKVWPLFNTGVTNFNYTRTYHMENVSRFSLVKSSRRWSLNYKVEQNWKTLKIHLVQYFKVRINSTLYAHYLGMWIRGASMTYVEEPYPVEARNFLNEELVVGRCNSSGEGTAAAEDEGPSAPASMDDVLHFITVRLNTTSSTRLYGKLGFRTYEGSWTGLLGALMDNSVDIALEAVTAHAARHQDMDFIFPIAETMCNIYIRQQETSTVRDIFLAPFSVRLIACVVAVATAAAAAVVVIAKLAPSVRSDSRRMGCAEAMIWATGILCQQGGTWTPPNPAANILLIVCLFFAVVIYNAYAGFITSVLSVRVASVDTVAAVLRSPDLNIGYIKNGADQMYLMSTKDVQLNAFYIRGYSDAQNLVSSAEEGLARAASQDYAFFAGQRSARSTLRSLSQARGRCALREVPVHSTRAQLALPLPRHSPYAKPMLLSLLQLRSGGCLARLEAALVPDMPHCAPPPGFASARATDVRSAMILLFVGYIAALIIGLSEFSWKNRRVIHIFFSKNYRRILKLFN